MGKIKEYIINMMENGIDVLHPHIYDEYKIYNNKKNKKNNKIKTNVK